MTIASSKGWVICVSCNRMCLLKKTSLLTRQKRFAVGMPDKRFSQFSRHFLSPVLDYLAQNWTFLPATPVFAKVHLCVGAPIRRLRPMYACRMVYFALNSEVANPR
jgi:hypothetical protein